MSHTITSRETVLTVSNSKKTALYPLKTSPFFFEILPYLELPHALPVLLCPLCPACRGVLTRESIAPETEIRAHCLVNAPLKHRFSAGPCPFVPPARQGPRGPKRAKGPPRGKRVPRAAGPGGMPQRKKPGHTGPRKRRVPGAVPGFFQRAKG